jgi:hypothetical protein
MYVTQVVDSCTFFKDTLVPVAYYNLTQKALLVVFLKEDDAPSSRLVAFWMSESLVANVRLSVLPMPLPEGPHFSYLTLGELIADEEVLKNIRKFFGRATSGDVENV